MDDPKNPESPAQFVPFFFRLMSQHVIRIGLVYDTPPEAQFKFCFDFFSPGKNKQKMESQAIVSLCSEEASTHDFRSKIAKPRREDAGKNRLVDTARPARTHPVTMLEKRTEQATAVAVHDTSRSSSVLLIGFVCVPGASVREQCVQKKKKLDAYSKKNTVCVVHVHIIALDRAL